MRFSALSHENRQHPCLLMNALLALRLHQLSQKHTTIPCSALTHPKPHYPTRFSYCNRLCVLIRFAFELSHPLFVGRGACPSRCIEPFHPHNLLKSTSTASPRTNTLASPRKRGGGTADTIFSLAVQYSDSPAFTILKLFRAVTVGIVPHPHHQ